MVWFQDRRWFDYNAPGCIAQRLHDTSDDSCAVAEAKLRDCDQLACRHCLTENTQAARDTMFACQGSDGIRKTCAAEVAKVSVACAAHINPGPGDPVRVCYPSANEPIASYFYRFITMWCGGGASDSLDASAEQ